MTGNFHRKFSVFLAVFLVFLVSASAILASGSGFLAGAQRFYKQYCRNRQTFSFLAVSCYLFEKVGQIESVNSDQSAKINELEQRVLVLESGSVPTVVPTATPVLSPTPTAAPTATPTIGPTATPALTTTPAPTATPTVISVVINEVSPGADPEWVELYNPLSVEANLAGCILYLDDDHAIQKIEFSNSDSISANDFKLIEKGDYNWTATWLNNSGDQVSLICPGLTDSISYGSQTGATLPAPTGAGSIGRETDGGIWKSCSATTPDLSNNGSC